MLYRFLIKIPLFGLYLRVLNNYIYSGDSEADNRFAPLFLWLKVLTPNFITVLILLAITNFDFAKHLLSGGNFHDGFLSEFSKNPGSMVLSVMPNLMGFGIGVYALLFALGGDFIKKLHRHMQDNVVKNGGHGSVLMLNAEMAYPILVVMSSIAIGIFQQLYPSNHYILILSWFYFWYALISMFEIVAVLFDLVSNSLLGKLD